MRKRSYSSLIPLTRLRQRASSGDSGVAALEFVLIAPLIIAILFGLIDYAIYFKHQSDVTIVAEQIANKVSRIENLKDDNKDSSINTTVLSIMKINQERLNPGDYIYVFRPDAVGDPIGSTETSPCPPNDCLKYYYAETTAGLPDPKVSTTTGGWTGRDQFKGEPNGCSIGVYVNSAHDWLLGSVPPILWLPLNTEVNDNAYSALYTKKINSGDLAKCYTATSKSVKTKKPKQEKPEREGHK